MKIVYWNISKQNQPLTGVKRYEDEIFFKIRELAPSLHIQRIQRSERAFLGSVPVSWIYRYPVLDADIVHATYQTLAPIAYLKRPKKFIVSVLDMTPVVYPATQTDISTHIQWIFTPGALKIPDTIIAISEFTKKELIRLCGLDEEKIEVIYPGVDHTRYHPIHRATCKKKFGLDANEKHLLVVASNLPHKRMDITKSVFERVRREYPHIKLVKVGYGDVLQGDGIINLGWVKEEDMPYLYNAADVFLHTAEYEGFGLPVLEAMACGVPVVVSKSASLPEIVKDSGHLIDLSTPEYGETFSSSILEVLQNGGMDNGCERSKVFTWERTAMETCALYDKVMDSI
jgi:glycosyltransferase involved in cell wall biosynthesis